MDDEDQEWHPSVQKKGDGIFKLGFGFEKLGVLNIPYETLYWTQDWIEAYINIL